MYICCNAENSDVISRLNQCTQTHSLSLIWFCIIYMIGTESYQCSRIAALYAPQEQEQGGQVISITCFVPFECQHFLLGGFIPVFTPLLLLLLRPLKIPAGCLKNKLILNFINFLVYYHETVANM